MPEVYHQFSIHLPDWVPLATWFGMIIVAIIILLWVLSKKEDVKQ